MDRSGSPPNDPSLLLLNEIEILLAQTRLMELYLKQAQVSAAHKAIGVHEQHQAELAELRRALAEKEQIVAVRQSVASTNEKKLTERIDNLQIRVSEQEALLASKEDQGRQSEVEVSALRHVIADLERAGKENEAAALSSAHARRDLECMLAALRLELEESRRDCQRQERLAHDLHESSRQQLECLQNQLAEQQDRAAAAGTELQRAKNEIDQLHRGIAQFHDERQELTAAVAREVEQARREFESQLRSLQSALSVRDHDLQHSQRAFGEIERVLNAEVQTLRKQFKDKQETLELRDDQLRGALVEIASLQQRIAELEAVHQQTNSAAAESAQTRAALESEIASLRRDVTSQERALTERQQTVAAVELALNAKIQDLQEELARGRSTLGARESELVNVRGESDSLRARVKVLEDAAHSEAAARQVLENATATLEARLAKLNAILAEKEATVRAAENGLRAHQEHFEGAITDLHRQLEDQIRINQQGALELNQLRSESARWREQNERSDLERREVEQRALEADAVRQQLTDRLQAKDGELRAALLYADEQKIAALAEQDRNFQLVSNRQRGETDRLHEELNRERIAKTQSGVELERLRSENAWLREQNQQSEQSRSELERNLQQAVALRQELETRLQAKQADCDFHAATIEQRDAALSDQAARLQSIEEQAAAERAQLHCLIDAHESAIERNHAERVQMQADLATLADDNRQLGAQRRELEVELREREGTLFEIQANVAGKQEQATRLTATLEQLNAELSQSRDQLEQQTQILERANHELTQLRGELSRLHEQNDRAEAERREFEQNWCQAEIRRQELAEQLEAKENELRRAPLTAHEQQENALRAQAARFEAGAGELRGELALLRSQLEERQKSAEQIERTSIERNTEITGLREQNRQVEQACSTLEQNWQQTINLYQEIEARLAAKEDELRAQHTTAEEQHNAALAEHAANTNARERKFAEEISQLRSQLEEQQRQTAQAHSEVSALHAEVSALRRVRADAEMARADLERQAELTAALHSELAASLQAKQDELEAAHATATAQLGAALREQEQRFTADEDRWKIEIARLRADLEEQARLATSASSEVVHVRSDLASVQQQNILSEQARRELEQNWQQIAALRQELEDHLRARDEELRATRSTASELKSELDAKLVRLESDLAEKQLLVNNRDGELDYFKNETSRLSADLAAREAALDEARSKFGKELELNQEMHQAELVALREESLSGQQTVEQQLFHSQEEIGALREQLQESQRRTDRSELEIITRQQNVAAAVAESAALRARVLELETRRHSENAAAREEFEQARTSLDRELKQLRTEVQQKTWALAQQQASMENLALAHKQRLQKLEDRLVEQHNANDRSEELGKAERENRSLHQRIEELQHQLRQVQAAAEQRAERPVEDYAARVETLSVEVSRQSAALQERESASARQEQLLRGEIEALIRQDQEKNNILLNRNDELVQAKADRDMLHERLTELESATNQSEAAVLEEAEQMRTEFQAQLALLQAELSQKEWALEEQRALAIGPDQQYRGQFEPHQKFDSAEAHLRQDPVPAIGPERVNGERQQSYRSDPPAHDAASGDPNRAARPRESRRWRTRFASKRRWIT